jgi:hypothetical protein
VKISKKKWLLIFLYLIVSFVAMTLLGFILIELIVELVLSIYIERSFTFSNINLMQCVKIGVAGGNVGAIGCWLIYYKNYK